MTLCSISKRGDLLTNCKNCGAPLKKNKCEYCGTEHILFNTENMYMTEEILNFSPIVYHDANGRLVREIIKPIKKTTFITY